MSILKLNFGVSPTYVGAILALADAWSLENGLLKGDSARLRMAAEEFSSYLAAVFAGEEAAVEFGEYGRHGTVRFGKFLSAAAKSFLTCVISESEITDSEPALS